jgi:putative transposase
MKGVAQLHTQYVNRTYRRTGTLWEGRFNSCLVQTEDYLLNCYRYVERNPVEAGLCNDAAEYEWSSCHTNAQGAFDEAIIPHEEYLRLGSTAEARRAAYRGLVASPLPPRVVDEVRKATSGNFALGTEKFKRSVSIALGRRAFPGEAGRPSRAATDDRDQGKLFDD